MSLELLLSPLIVIDNLKSSENNEAPILCHVIASTRIVIQREGGIHRRSRFFEIIEIDHAAERQPERVQQVRGEDVVLSQRNVLVAAPADI